jgi:hypothetical protein
MGTSWHLTEPTWLTDHDLWRGAGRVKARWHDVPVALDLGEGTAAASGNGRTPPALDVHPAIRGHRPAWRDPRLWIGIVVVAASVVAGARVLAAADDTVQVWAAAGDLGAGQRVEPADLVARRVRFAESDALSGYFTVDDELPAALELTRSVGRGELLPRAAVGAPDETGLVEVPIAVEPELVPPDVESGDLVDLYVVAPISADAEGRQQEPPPAGPALTAATVVAAPELASSFGTSGKRQLVLGVEADAAPAFFALLARYDAPSLTVVRRG